MRIKIQSVANLRWMDGNSNFLITKNQLNNLVEVLLELRDALLADEGSHVLRNVDPLHLDLDAKLIVLVVGPRSQQICQ